MKKKTVGAFEAKTHFSQLLKDVEDGTVVHVTHRGRAVAVLRSEETDESRSALAVLDRINRRRREMAKGSGLSTDEILEFRDEGRRF